MDANLDLARLYLSRLPSLRIPLSSKEALAEYQIELDRLDSIRDLDGKPADLDPGKGSVKSSRLGDCSTPRSESWGCTFEEKFSDRDNPVLIYTKLDTQFPTPPVGPLVNMAGHSAEASGPSFETFVEGYNDSQINRWVARRLVEGPSGIRYEELNINYADPASSTKEVWLLSS